MLLYVLDCVRASVVTRDVTLLLRQRVELASVWMRCARFYCTCLTVSALVLLYVSYYVSTPERRRPQLSNLSFAYPSLPPPPQPFLHLSSRALGDKLLPQPRVLVRQPARPRLRRRRARRRKLLVLLLQPPHLRLQVFLS